MTAILVLTRGALATAEAVRQALPGARLHGPPARVPEADVPVSAVGTHLRDLFAAGTPIVGICAAGILIRALAPAVADKAGEPAVLAVAQDGSSVVPLLGGHRGANRLAADLAAALGGHAAVTTAGDHRFATALDAPPDGWRLANRQDYPGFAADLLDGAGVVLSADDGTAVPPWLAEAALPVDPAAGHRITTTVRAAAGDRRHLVYHPAALALGVGTERGADADALTATARDALAAAGLAAAAVACVVSLDRKADEPAVHALAKELGVPARFFPPDVLAAEEHRLATPSDVVRQEIGLAGVAEAAALAAAGPDGRLLAPKRKGPQVTVAVAAAPAPIDIAATGRPRGRLFVVGTGPGGVAWRTPAVDRAVATAEILVGYGLYLDLLGNAAAGKERREFPLGAESERVAASLALAAEGRCVALVSSGDPGIYAMASLVFETLAGSDDPAWHRIAVEVVPGLSAMQLAAGRIGAPLGHDFAAISLSDLLTPWPVIERRIEAAAAADFAIAFYNPVSARRREGLARARTLLLAHRAPDTPVVLARNLGRPAESVRVVDLADLDIDAVDMLTVVLVGARSTRRVARPNGGVAVYTPRGYAAKREPALAEDRPPGTVHFIGAGPGAPDLMTLRGRALMAASAVCLYAGSLVPPEVLAHAAPGARLIDTAPLTLDEIMAALIGAARDGHDVARLQSGDPSLYGATAEQMRRLDAAGIAYDITPGVPAYAAAAATLKTELTLPGVSQTVILTRTAMQSSDMPAGEDLATLARSGATLALHLSIRNLAAVTRALAPHYGEDCPVAVVYRASWPDEEVLRCRLDEVAAQVRARKITRTALVLVGRVLDPALAATAADSALYAPGHAHILRPVRRPEPT